jgi:O-Antigen ligase
VSSLPASRHEMVARVGSPSVWRSVVPAALSLVLATAVLDNGGYFPSSWAWLALSFSWLSALALVLRPHSLRHSYTMPLALFALCVWSLASSMWALVASDAVSQVEGTLVVALGVTAFLLLIDRSSLEGAIVAVYLGMAVVCAYALSTRLFADHFGADAIGGYRLSRPVGYWNGLGIYAAIALAIAFGVLPHAGRLVRVLLAIPLPVIAVTGYFTYSRGSAIALGFALAAIFVLDPERIEWLLRSLIVGAIAGIGVIAASSFSALTTVGAGDGNIANDGHRLALILFVLCLVSAAEAIAPRRIFTVPRRFKRPATIVVSATAICAILLGVATAGGPRGLWDKFASPPKVAQANLNARLFTFSGSYRTPIWKQALREYEANKLLGGGAGSYESYYLQHRVRADKVRNAHNLYLETVAELGLIGLGLLLIALLSPFVVVWRVRANPLVPGLAGAYVAFLAHLAVDWDWQLTGVALTGLFCGAGILIAARPDPEEPMAERTRRTFIALGVAVTLVSFVMLVGNLSLARASSAASAGNWKASARDAKRARDWAPWSSEPYRLLGEAQLGQGATKAAAATFRRGIDRSPKDWNLWFDLARTTLGATQRDALAHAANLNPLSPEIRELRSELAQEKQITVGRPAS